MISLLFKQRDFARIYEGLHFVTLKNLGAFKIGSLGGLGIELFWESKDYIILAQWIFTVVHMMQDVSMWVVG